MAVMDILHLPDPILRRKAHKVLVFDKEFNKLADDMIETLRAAPGVGLAAPQVGVSQRLIVIEYGEEDEEGKEAPKKLYVVANPEIISTSEQIVNGVEACLSVPNLVGEVERYYGITVKGQNRKGKPVKIKAQGWLARVFQHEIDHLDGIIYTDRATEVWKPKEGEDYAAD
ncbi:peptide deformylase [Leptolinea tardivitalis]|uniref:Peptide deformylase n=1 Tax=Leptolinea tardivitalis TaxID=229920 RepID=A0A0P6XMP6_9CHLR|nr:peptide deformylase [Leptolinea tardivitalis]KPL70201.1 peptide deformylase [Leptolinea tardivitalis]GAP21732.1 peptide deformylase [Leptolinea tardivitalis]